MFDKRDALNYHSAGRPGKIEVVATKPLSSQRDLSLAYTPGVAEACRAIHANVEDVFKYTAKGNLVAVVTNGTAVLGLGDIGPEAAKPVMEGKANLFKKFADIDVFDIELNASTVEEMLQIIVAMAPTFGGINLEDIKAPECFELERRLQDQLDIPVFHDDQHGTAVISAAALLNAAKLTGRNLAEARIVVSGAGAAAMACCWHYVAMGATRENIIMCDSRGVIQEKRPGLKPEKADFATQSSAKTLAEALVDADVFVGLSVGDVVSAEMIMAMAPKPIIFAMANPDPEIPYELAKRTRPDAIVATGRSDHPNQVNNVLGFPFVFRGALDCNARRITQEMKVAATEALAALACEEVPEGVLQAYSVDQMRFGPDYIIPKPFDPRVLLWVAPAVAKAAKASGVARNPIQDLDGYRQRLHLLVERSRGLMQPLIDRARNSPRQRIVFPDGDAVPVLRAAQVLVDEGICTPMLLGDQAQIRAVAAEHRVDLTGIDVINPLTDERTPWLAQRYWEQRRRKGVTRATAESRMRARKWFAVMMVQEGLSDGMVGGLGRAYAKTLQPALQALGTDATSRVVSGVYAAILDDRKIFLGDCTVNRHPDAETLAEIAFNTAKVASTFGQVPRVAMLSYSDFGEHHRDPEVAKVRRAVEIVRERWPELEIDGEMQADTAVNWQKMQTYFPFSKLTGPANVLVFPDLTSGNIAQKLLFKLADAQGVGPLLVGLGGAVNVMPVHATVNEIVDVVTYTVNVALDQAEG